MVGAASKKSTEAETPASEEAREEEPAKTQKSRSTSRGVFNRLKGKKEELETKKEEKKEEKAAEKEEKPVEAAPVTAPAAAIVADGVDSDAPVPCKLNPYSM